MAESMDESMDGSMEEIIETMVWTGETTPEGTMVWGITETIVETKETYFILDYPMTADVQRIPKSKVSSYKALLDAIKPKQNLGKQRISYLRPINKKSRKVDPSVKITADNGDEWVDECKKGGDTWFTVVYDGGSVVDDFADDPDCDVFKNPANNDSDIEPIALDAANNGGNSLNHNDSVYSSVHSSDHSSDHSSNESMP